MAIGQQVGFWFSLFCRDSPEVMTFCELPPDTEAATFDSDSSIEISRVGNARLKITSGDMVICSTTDPLRWREGVFSFVDSTGVRHKLEVFGSSVAARRAVDDWNDSSRLEGFLDGEEDEDD
ncbi:MAG: hypothetical protein AAB839_03230 [Patescibacteria group bacterium]